MMQRSDKTGLEERDQQFADAGIPTVVVRGKSGVGAAFWVVLIATIVPVACLAIPMYVIRPFRPQDPSQLALALTVRDFAPWLSAICVIAAVVAVFWAWKKIRRIWLRIGFVALLLIAIVGAWLTTVNIFEHMFHPYPSPEFTNPATAQVNSDDKVLAVLINAEARAYPIRTMGYHHIVNDTVGNTPIAVTYCTLCHTGLVWSRILDGKTLQFHLAGINNGNALMRDQETSSIWQQSTGQAIFGPLKGRQLSLVHSDELTFNLWRKEQPNGLVLKPDAQYVSEYDDKDWEKHVEKTRTVVDTQKSGIAAHELMLGITIAGQSKVYPVKSVLAGKLIEDRAGGIPILFVVGPDHASIRVFAARLAEAAMTFVPTQDSSRIAQGSIMQDVETGSDWNFEGCAISGKLTGKCLTPLDANKDYWFDWMNHHPATSVFKN